MSIKILTGANHLPEHRMTNAELEKMVDTNDEWITSRVGISERRIYKEGESANQSMIAAAKAMCQQADVDPQAIGLIIVASSSIDQIMPSSACIVQGGLKIEKCTAFDLQAACAGFVYAMSIADSLMRSNPTISYALVFGAETLSKIVDWTDRSTCVLFGDGAGGILLENNPADSDEGIISYYLDSDGKSQEQLGVWWGIGQGIDNLKDNNHCIHMNGRDVFRNSIKYFANAVQECVAASEYDLEDIDWIVPHQANNRIMVMVAEKLGMPEEKMISTIKYFGNTSSASIPLAFNHVINTEDKIKRGDLVLFVGFGAGYTSGAVLFRY